MRALLMATFTALVFAHSVAANCRQALAIGLDVSGSVDLREYRLQLDGLIAALNHPDVVKTLLAAPDAPVTLMVFEWSGPADQSVLVPWTTVTDASTLEYLSKTLAGITRRETSPGTALGMAMTLGTAYLDQQLGCWKRTLDISGDGQSNLGPRPRDVRQVAQGKGITINGLAIGASARDSSNNQSEIGELSAYFQSEVITGPDAFVQTASDFEDYATAMTAKLQRELGGLAVSVLQ